jgi:hypothetical protein
MVVAENAALRSKPFARVSSADSFIPLADAANLVLMQEDEIVATTLAISGGTRAVIPPEQRPS